LDLETTKIPLLRSYGSRPDAGAFVKQ